jgi:biopolymer transport protein ExbB
LFTIIRDAGWPIWPLLFTSILAVAFIIERSWALRRKRILPVQLTDEVLSVLHNTSNVTPETLERLRHHSPLGQILSVGLQELVRGSDQAAACMQEAGKRVAHELERYLNALGTIASVAPLMGLFGTVIGMIEIFASQDASTGSPTALAHGISIALYNTAFGLLVAIPALICWRTFRRHIDQLVFDLEIQAAYFLKQATQHKQK